MHTIATGHKSADADYITPSPCTTFMVPCNVCGTVSNHFSSGLEDTHVQSGVQIGYQPQSINQLFLFVWCWCQQFQQLMQASAEHAQVMPALRMWLILGKSQSGIESHFNDCFTTD